ncbi:hypothetical protein HAINFHK1212_0757, partial [Haemophilus influenzae HK1212]
RHCLFHKNVCNTRVQKCVQWSIEQIEIDPNRYKNTTF